MQQPEARISQRYCIVAVIAKHIISCVISCYRVIVALAPHIVGFRVASQGILFFCADKQIRLAAECLIIHCGIAIFDVFNALARIGELTLEHDVNLMHGIIQQKIAVQTDKLQIIRINVIIQRQCISCSGVSAGLL